jgi:hypothetical protein
MAASHDELPKGDSYLMILARVVCFFLHHNWSKVVKSKMLVYDGFFIKGYQNSEKRLCTRCGKKDEYVWFQQEFRDPFKLEVGQL